ncbi:unnamed protein product, partial [Musa acuminata var. zebrina]
MPIYEQPLDFRSSSHSLQQHLGDEDSNGLQQQQVLRPPGLHATSSVSCKRGSVKNNAEKSTTKKHKTNTSCGGVSVSYSRYQNVAGQRILMVMKAQQVAFTPLQSNGVA